MSKTTVPLIAVTIRRDANTITPITVPPYETIVLRSLFGKENVTGDEVVGQIEVEAESEYERIGAKYGSDIAAKVYGDDEGARLTELVEKSAIKEKSLTKAEKAAADAAAAGAGK
jgi:hypothetical protein